MTSMPILHCTNEIDLSVVFDSNLSFRNHISMSIDKANRLHGIIRSFSALDITSSALLCKTIVRTYFEYADTIWIPYKKGHIDDLQKVQCWATKLLQSISHLSYPDLAALNLPPLVYLRMRGDMIETFMIL